MSPLIVFEDLLSRMSVPSMTWDVSPTSWFAPAVTVSFSGEPIVIVRLPLVSRRTPLTFWISRSWVVCAPASRKKPHPASTTSSPMMAIPIAAAANHFRFIVHVLSGGLLSPGNARARCQRCQ